ncbi:hypothetical protein A0U94_06515 [Gluconobacter albidus]|uniref:hypothetical protein n=1 Tax=Gluconobacter albidus TaxID=318683 RepID=UPI00098B3334|nr:hypothetical protein [Gluconobacter albidus]AQS90676.1 hypothetical protein A0U94_06515 [Gluconobacter albidus]
MARPSLDYDRIAPAVRRLYAGGSSVRVIAAKVGISVGSAHALIGQIGLIRPVADKAGACAKRRRPLPAGACLEIARV